MFQGDLIYEQDDREQTCSLGNGFVLEFSARENRQCKLLYYDKPIKIVDLSDKVAKKLLVIEAVELGGHTISLGRCLGDLPANHP